MRRRRRRRRRRKRRRTRTRRRRRRKRKRRSAPREVVVVHGQLQIMIQDERAHKFVLQVKGAAGIKPCMLCKNVVNPNSDLLPDPTGWLIPAHCVDPSKFDLYTTEEI
eukprot:2806442-Pyramimonas_sp.AAC.1